MTRTISVDALAYRRTYRPDWLADQTGVRRMQAAAHVADSRAGGVEGWRLRSLKTPQLVRVDHDARAQVRRYLALAELVRAGFKARTVLTAMTTWHCSAAREAEDRRYHGPSVFQVFYDRELKRLCREYLDANPPLFAAALLPRKIRVTVDRDPGDEA